MIKRILNLRITIEEVKEKIKQVHNDVVILDESTYIDTRHLARFIDKELGEFFKTPNKVFIGRGHPERSAEKYKQTMKERYGCTNPMQNKEIALKAARSQNNSGVIKHWKTGEDCVWVGSFEKSVLLDRNEKQIEYLWQPEVFMLCDGHTYRPDMYLVKEKIWVEIKRISKRRWDAKV